MAITKDSGRQQLIHASVDISYADFDTSIIGTSSTSTVEAIDLPLNAIVLGGSLVVKTAWNTEGVRAYGVLTSSGQPTSTNTVTIGSQTYTFKTSLTASTTAYEVLIGADETESLANLVAAINLGAGSGVKYGSLTPANSTVTAETDGVHTVTVTSIVASSANDAVATTETHANASWGAATLVDYVVPADTFTIKIGNEIYLTTTSVDATGRTALVPTGTKLSTSDTVDVVWDVANTTTVAPTAGSARLEVQYIIDGRAKFSQG